MVRRIGALLLVLGLASEARAAEVETSSAAPASLSASSPSSGWLVGRARGSVLLWSGTRSEAAQLGAVLGADAALEVGGWCELWSTGDARMRLSAGARVRSAGPALEVQRGRAWVQLGRGARALDVRVGRWRVEVLPGASVVIERAGGAGSTVVVRVGEVRVHGDAGHPPVRAQPGDAVRGEPPVVRSGGAALLDLVASEARDAQGDPAQLARFLVERARTAPIGRLGTRAVTDILRVDPELAGADGGSMGLTLEEAIRPPPFFEREVPTKGPNAEIVVEFAQ